MMHYYKIPQKTMNAFGEIEERYEWQIQEEENERKKQYEVSEEEYNAYMLKEDLQVKIDLNKSKLSETDYIACKIAEGSATTLEYAFEIEQRQLLRAEINSYEEQLKGLN